MKRYDNLSILSISFLTLILLLSTACGTLEVGIEHTSSAYDTATTPATTTPPEILTLDPIAHATVSVLATENAHLATQAAAQALSPTLDQRAQATVSALATRNAYLKTQVAVRATITPSITPTPPGTPEASSGDKNAFDLVEPLLIDGEKGWIFAAAQMDGQPKTVKLATQDGHLLEAYDVVGKLALDRTGNRLFVDQGEGGIAIMDAQTDALLTTVTLPAASPANVDPQVDPTTGLAYAFRDKTVYVIDPTAAAVAQSVTLSIPSTVCDDPRGDASIAHSFYDLVNRRLYLVFVTYVCTPWVTHTIVAYDVAALAELGRYQTGLDYHAVPFSDSLYGTMAVGQLGRNVSWAWNGHEAWFEEGSEYRRLQGIVADWGRQLVYEALEGQIWTFKPYPREVMGQVDVALLTDGGRLAGHDPISDQLYFLVDGQLRIRPTTTLTTRPISPTNSELWSSVSVSPDTLVAIQTQPDSEPYQFGDIATMHVDGTHITQLTNYRYNTDPVLSTDGKRIAYRSIPSSITSLDDLGSRLYQGYYNIWVITTDYSQAWQLTSSEDQRSIPVWSPDSQKVIFSEGSDGLLVEVEVETGARHEITAGAFAPRYRPDGSGIGYVTAEGGLAWIDAAGTVHAIILPATLPANTSVKDFDWLPDGEHVVYTLADETGRIEDTTIGIEYSAWIARADGSNPLKLVDDVRGLKASPDGRTIAALQGSGWFDACFVDQKLVFLLLAPDLASAQLVGIGGFEGYPQTGPDQSFYLLSETGQITPGNVTWISDRLVLGNFGLTCTLDHSVAGRYVIDPIGEQMVQITQSEK